MHHRIVHSVVIATMAAGCATPRVPEPRPGPAAEPPRRAEAIPRRAPVRPGITVLLEDSVHLIRGRRIGLITNQTGIDELGRSDIDLLSSGERARAAGASLVALFAPEHGIRGTEQRSNLPSGIDETTGVPIHSLYTSGTIGPPDSTLRGVGALVFDLQDIGTRTWTYVGVLVYSLRAAQRNRIPIIVLDRPNPITGSAASPPMLDAAIANPEDPAPGKPGLAYALFPFPLRHGMTMGEMARFYNDSLAIGAELHVVPAAGWKRSMWFDETGLPWVRPSPNLPSLESALLYPALVALEATNISVGRGTPMAHRVIGAPGLDARALARVLEEQELPGIRFRETTFIANRYGRQQPYQGDTVPGVELVVTDRERVQVGRLGATVLWALLRTNRSVVRITDARLFDLRFGSPAMREALLRGEDPDAVIDRDVAAVAEFERATRRFWLYR